MIYVMLANGFEEVEALTVVDVLRRANFDVQTVSITHSFQVEGAHGVIVNADNIFTEVSLAESELVVLPGGIPGALNLRNDETLCAVLKKRASENLAVAAICAAPFILGELGILQGKRATCYPGFEDKLAGATVTGAMVERDGNIITGKGPAAAMEFALTIVEALAGKGVRDEVAGGMLVG